MKKISIFLSVFAIIWLSLLTVKSVDLYERYSSLSKDSAKRHSSLQQNLQRNLELSFKNNRAIQHLVKNKASNDAHAHLPNFDTKELELLVNRIDSKINQNSKKINTLNDEFFKLKSKQDSLMKNARFIDKNSKKINALNNEISNLKKNSLGQKIIKTKHSIKQKYTNAKRFVNKKIEERKKNPYVIPDDMREMLQL
jgi:predicted ribosome quality control (RQC) complex YloA/Tae2 family protein